MSLFLSMYYNEKTHTTTSCTRPVTSCTSLSVQLGHDFVDYLRAGEIRLLLLHTHTVMRITLSLSPRVYIMSILHRAEQRSARREYVKAAPRGRLVSLSHYAHCRPLLLLLDAPITSIYLAVSLSFLLSHSLCCCCCAE